MSNIVEKINAVPDLVHLTGCVTSQVIEAQKALNIAFPEEYIEYVKKFGVISFYGTEWTGLNVEGNLNVVTATEQERHLDNTFPKDCFVVENIGIDGVFTIMDENGKIFSYQRGEKRLLCDTLCEYLEICTSRKK